MSTAIDWERRHRLMRYHTALHLLGAVVKAPVTGGRIADDKAHLDFDIEMEKLVKDEIEARLNELASVDRRPRTWITDAELDAARAGEDHVGRAAARRRPRAPARDPRGRPAGLRRHARANTAEIGRLAVARIRSEGKRNKRVTLISA